MYVCSHPDRRDVTRQSQERGAGNTFATSSAVWTHLVWGTGEGGESHVWRKGLISEYEAHKAFWGHFLLAHLKNAKHALQ